MASTSTDSPFLESPAPWKCKGECFWLFGQAKAGAYPGPAEFHPLEGTSSFADPSKSGEYRGGQTSVMIVSYHESPVGPYDELMWIPGGFVVPSTGQEAKRVTRIYVSSKDSVYNGRKNWNICKTLADFSFVPRGDSNPAALPYSRISVAPPGQPDSPFFVIDLEPTMFFSTAWIPFNTTYLPLDSTTVNPPLPQSPNWKEDGCVGTDSWMSVASGMKGKAGFYRAKGGMEGGALADNAGFPNVELWSIGMWLRDFHLDFPVATVLEKKDQSGSHYSGVVYDTW